MNTKKKITILAAIIACVSILALGSLAYFTAQDTANNQITAGNLGIAIHETDENGDPFVNQTGVMPGDTIAKVVKIENTGDNTAWIRVKVTMSCTDANQLALSTDNITLNYNTTDWTYSNGYYYYNSPVDGGAFTNELFSSVAFDISLGNSYMDAVLSIDVDAEAVQYANNGVTVLDAQGWPAE